MRRRPWLVALPLLALLLGADTVGWFVATSRLRSGLQAWEAALRASGWTIASAGARAGGWPLAAEVTLPVPNLQHGPAAMPGAIALAAPAMTLSLPLWHPSTLRLSVAGPLHVRAGDRPEAVLTAADLDVTVPMMPDAASVFHVRAVDPRLGPASGAWHAAAAWLTLDGSVPAGAGRADPAQPPAGIVLQASALVLPVPFKSPAASTIDALSMRAVLKGPPPPLREPPLPWAEAWRDAGGSLVLTRVAVESGPLRIGGTATMGLDEQLQPNGRGEAEISGYAPMLDRLAAAGVLTRPAAMTAKALLSLLAGSDGSAEAPLIHVPLVLQSRTLSIGQLPLFRFPPLDWTAGH